MNRNWIAVLALGIGVNASTARADIFNITATFAGGLTGTGSFQTNGTCGFCSAPATITGFTFTVDDDTFTTLAAGSSFVRSSALLNFTATGADDPSDVLLLTSSNTAILQDDFGSLYNGTYTVAAGTAAVPEPSSAIMLFTALAGVVVVARRRAVRLSRQCSS